MIPSILRAATRRVAVVAAIAVLACIGAGVAIGWLL